MMFDRSAGPYLTFDKFDRLTQSVLGLGRIKVGEGGENEQEWRSIREAWLGFKPNEGDIFNKEAAIDLGDIPWEQTKVPEDVRERIIGGGVEDQTIKGKEIKEPKLDLKAITDNLEGYFWVMNFLAGDDNPAKRPWQFIMKGVERSGDLQKPEAYTDKIKFWKIIWHDNMIVWGDWRKEYQKVKSELGGKGLKPEDLVRETEGRVKIRAKNMLNVGKKWWYEGLRSLSDYPTWATQQIKYLRYEQGVLKAGTADLIDVVEGSNLDNPGLAVRYGFMDAGQINKPPQHQMRLFR